VKAAAADGTTTLVERDEYVRTDASLDALDALERLRPAFWHQDWDARFPDLPWITTAGNSSPLTDGASAVLLVSERAADRLGLAARARVRATSAVGDDPLMMLTAIIPATRRVLERASLRLDDVDSFEINEAFASVVQAPSRSGTHWAPPEPALPGRCSTCWKPGMARSASVRSVKPVARRTPCFLNGSEPWSRWGGSLNTLRLEDEP
jgi:acetyl-CoA acetyltransferase